MDQYNDFVFQKVTKEDVNALTKIMKRAFDEDARRHLGEEAGGPPGYDDGSFIRKWYFHQDVQAFKVLKEGRLIGAFAVFIHADNENFLGNIFVDPSCQDKGVGTRIWEAVERKYPHTKIWRTETPGFSKRNHYFYVNKCGFKVVKIENPKDIYEELYRLEKEMPMTHN